MIHDVSLQMHFSNRYHQIINTDEERRGWSLYDCRMRARDWLARSIGPLGNTIFLVATRT